MAGSQPASRRSSRPGSPHVEGQDNRRVRRRKEREREREKAGSGDAVAATPSGSRRHTESTGNEGVKTREKGKGKEKVNGTEKANGTTVQETGKVQGKGKGKEKEKADKDVSLTNPFGSADFIAFDVSDDEKSAVPQADSRPVREWDKGKVREREREYAGREREYAGRKREYAGREREYAGREREYAGRKRKVDEFDPDDAYANNRQRVAAPSRKAPWAADVAWESCNNVAEMLHRDVEAFVRYISPTPVEDEVRTLVVMLVTYAITQAFPDAQVLPFGSYETKLYLPLGDIDLVVHSQSMAYSDKETVLWALADTMKRAGITDRVKIIARAKVPIVKFVTTHGHFSVDISVNQINGVAAGHMIKLFLAEFPALRSLVLVVKSFLSQRSMNEVFTGGLGSYSIVCLVISFLQMHPKIRRGEIDPSKNLGVLVMEFFELYGCYFNYHEVGISLRDGGTYFNKEDRGWLNYNEPRLLSIEDPGDATNDISRGSYGIARVRTTLSGAHGIMTAAAYLQAGIFNARRERRDFDLRFTDRPEELSILASVMGVTQETINHRRLVQEVYDCGVLHRMLGLTPQATLAPKVSRPEPNGKSRTSQKESVQTAWEEADMELESDEERDGKVSDEESRYDIDNRVQPPKKRQRVGKQQDMHTVYTTDEEDEDGEILDDGEDGLSREELEYDLSELQEDEVGRKLEAQERRRSYWISKGLDVASDTSGTVE